MNLIPVYRSGDANQAEGRGNQVSTANDAALGTAAQARIDALTAEKDAAVTALNALCAVAEREEHYLGSGQRSAEPINRLVADITRLEAQIAYYTAAKAVLAP